MSILKTDHSRPKQSQVKVFSRGEDLSDDRKGKMLVLSLAG